MGDDFDEDEEEGLCATLISIMFCSKHFLSQENYVVMHGLTSFLHTDMDANEDTPKKPEEGSTEGAFDPASFEFKKPTRKYRRKNYTQKKGSLKWLKWFA